MNTIEVETLKSQLAALVTEIDMLNVSSSMQVQVARQHLLERAAVITPETQSLMNSLIEARRENAALREELESRRRHMDEINDLLYAAQGKPGTFKFNQTLMVDDVKALIAERDMLKTLYVTSQED